MMLDATVAVALAHRESPPTGSTPLITTALTTPVRRRRARVWRRRLPDTRIEELLHDDAALNAAGLIAWLDRPSRAPGRAVSG